ncbi:hypothetical protein, partial [Prevotella pectinovora]|uniref:hypothetical protein n=1 Tax=Prevotella pectinovora TaxID=1602169 RepID=UPI002FDB34CD
MWRTMLAQVGHAACPSGAQTLPEQCPNDLWNDYLSKGVEQLASEQTPDFITFLRHHIAQIENQ